MNYSTKLGFLAILGLLTFSDLFSGNLNEVNAEKNIPTPKMSQFMGPTVKFLYCYSWSYRKVFEQYAGILQQKYPDLAIQGDNFPPTPWKWQLAQFLGMSKFVIIICVILNLNPFQWTGAPTPGVYEWLLTNKLYACMMVFFLSNAMETQLISTGAFEISVDNMPLWSKIESGRIPQPPELFQIIDNHFKMKTGTPGVADEALNQFRDEL